MRNKSWWWVAVGAALGCVVFGLSRLPLGDAEVHRVSTLAPPHRPAPPPVFVPEPPPAEPSAEVPTLIEASEEKIDVRVNALAREMADMWTRNPEELVVVIDDAARSMPSAPSVTLLLAIAHAETRTARFSMCPKPARSDWRRRRRSRIARNISTGSCS